MATKATTMPKFKTESEEAEWWAGAAGRIYLKKHAEAVKGVSGKPAGSQLVAKLNRKSSVQIAIRLPEADLLKARELAERKGVGYQTFLKMLVHEGLARESRRM